jgi:hypothetical protein
MNDRWHYMMDYINFAWHCMGRLGEVSAATEHAAAPPPKHTHMGCCAVVWAGWRACGVYLRLWAPCGGGCGRGCCRHVAAASPQLLCRCCACGAPARGGRGGEGEGGQGCGAAATTAGSWLLLAAGWCPHGGRWRLANTNGITSRFNCMSQSRTVQWVSPLWLWMNLSVLWQCHGYMHCKRQNTLVHPMQHIKNHLLVAILMDAIGWCKGIEKQMDPSRFSSCHSIFSSTLSRLALYNKKTRPSIKFHAICIGITCTCHVIHVKIM